MTRNENIHFEPDS